MSRVSAGSTPDGRTGRDATSPRAARPASRVYSNVCLAEPDIDPYDTCVYVMELATGPRERVQRNYNGQKGGRAAGCLLGSPPWGRSVCLKSAMPSAWMRAICLASLYLTASVSCQGIPDGGGGGGFQGGSDDAGASSGDNDEDRCLVSNCHRCSRWSRHECETCDTGYMLASHVGFTIGMRQCMPCASRCNVCDKAGPHSCDDAGCSSGSFRTADGSLFLCTKCSAGCARCTTARPQDCTACDWLYTRMEGGSGGCAFSWYRLLALLATFGVGFATWWFMPTTRPPRELTMARERQRHLDHVGRLAGDAPSMAAIYPSGAWRGYYTHVDGQHGVCEFRLAFEPDGTIRGSGTDDVGEYTIEGLFGVADDGGPIAFTKSYTPGSRSAGGRVKRENKGHRVEYHGRAARTDEVGCPVLGNGVRGGWTIRHVRGRHDGVFHLWPVVMSRAAQEASPGVNDDEEETECCVCYDRRVDVKLEPCGHVALCGECAGRLRPQRCPLCRVDIDRVDVVQ